MQWVRERSIKVTVADYNQKTSPQGGGRGLDTPILGGIKVGGRCGQRETNCNNYLGDTICEEGVF